MYWHEKKQFFHSLCKKIFLFVEKRQLLYNWLSMAWSWYRNQRDLYIDTVYLEPVPWLLKGSEDYCFKKMKNKLDFQVL